MAESEIVTLNGLFKYSFYGLRVFVTSFHKLLKAQCQKHHTHWNMQDH